MEGLLLQPREVLDAEGRLLCLGAFCTSVRGQIPHQDHRHCCQYAVSTKRVVPRKSKEKISFAENTSNIIPAPNAKVRQKKRQIYGQLTAQVRKDKRFPYRLCLGESLFCEDNSVVLSSRLPTLSQSLPQTTFLTSQSKHKALEALKGQSGLKHTAFWIEEISHPRLMGLLRSESYISR